MLGRMNKYFCTDKNSCVIVISCHVIQHDLYLGNYYNKTCLCSVFVFFSVSVFSLNSVVVIFLRRAFCFIVSVLYLTGEFGEHGEIGKTRGVLTTFESIDS